ncbi:MAG: outer membrane beta-barrel protein [Hyphomicrobiales bacterium]
MRKQLFAILVLLLPISIHAQKAHDKKIDVEALYGASIPIGDFGNKNALSTNPGYAKYGYNFSLGLSYYFYDNLGLMMKYQSSKYSVDVENVADTLRKNYPGSMWNIKSGEYELNSYMGGIIYKIPSESVIFNLYGLLGVSKVDLPEIVYGGSNSNEEIIYTQKAHTSTSLSFNFGAKFNWYVYKDLYVLGSADLFSTNPKFDDYGLINDGQAVLRKKLNQTITTVNLSIGIGISL